MLFYALLEQVANQKKHRNGSNVSGRNFRPSSISIPHRRRQAEESGDAFAVLPALIRASIIIGSTIKAGMTGLLVSTTARRLPVFNLNERVFFFLIYCTFGSVVAPQRLQGPVRQIEEVRRFLAHMVLC